MVYEVGNSTSGTRKRILFAALPLLALSGCELGPNFTQPTPTTPAGFKADIAVHGTASVSSDSVPDPDWWTSFQDPELTALEKLVVSQNLDVQIATARVDEAVSEANISRAALYPSLNLKGEYTREKPFSKADIQGLGIPSDSPVSGFVGGFSNPINLFQYGFSALFDLDLWGKNKRAVEAAAAAAQASSEARRAALLNAEAAIAQDYIQLRGVQAVIAITEKNLHSAQQLVSLTQDRENAGLTTALDVANARTQEATTAAQIPRLTNQRDALISNIEILIGALPGALEDQLVQAEAVPPVPPSVPIGMPASLLRRRPDIREAEATLHENTAEVGVAVASFFPDISLSASVNLQALQLSRLNQLNAVTYAMGPVLSLPIFQGGQLSATLTLRKAAQREAAITYAKTVITAFHQVDDALTAYSQEQATSQQLSIAVDQSAKALSLAEDQYRQGLADYLQVLNAQQALLSAQQSQAEAIEAVSADLVTLYQALGGGWQQTYPTQPSATVEARSE